MKKSELKKQIEEVITETLSEADIDKTSGAVVMKKTTPPSEIKKVTAQGIDVELKESEDEEFDTPEKEPSKFLLKILQKLGTVYKTSRSTCLTSGCRVLRFFSILSTSEPRQSTIFSPWFNKNS